MFEYEVMNKITNEILFIYGRDWQNALSRYPKLNANELIVIHSEYVD